jgi:hypothetical protein
VHPPILVGVGLVMRDVHPEQVIKFAVVAAIAVPVCFIAAGLVRRLPYAARVV